MRSSGILTVVSNSGPRAAAANPPQFPDGGTGTPRREGKVRYRRVDDKGATFQKFQGSFQCRVKNSLYPGVRIRALQEKLNINF